MSCNVPICLSPQSAEQTEQFSEVHRTWEWRGGRLGQVNGCLRWLRLLVAAQVPASRLVVPETFLQGASSARTLVLSSERAIALPWWIRSAWDRFALLMQKWWQTVHGGVSMRIVSLPQNRSQAGSVSLGVRLQRPIPAETHAVLPLQTLGSWGLDWLADFLRQRPGLRDDTQSLLVMELLEMLLTEGAMMPETSHASPALHRAWNSTPEPQNKRSMEERWITMMWGESKMGYMECT